MDKSLAITYNGSRSLSGFRAPFVHLEQVKQPTSAETVSMYDISQMISRARMGQSARTYKPDGCAAEISGDTISVWFDFYAWASAPNLEYSVSSSLGEVSDPTITNKFVEFSDTFELSDKIELDFILEDDESFSYSWETECWNSAGVQLDKRPDVWLEDYHTIRASEPVFGVIRIQGKKRGTKFTLTTRLIRRVPAPVDGSLPNENAFTESGAGQFYSYQEWLDKFYGHNNIDAWNDGENTQPVPPAPINMTGLKITNLKATVTAHWIGLDGEEDTDKLTMEVSQCVKDLLAACDGDEDAILGGSTFNICGPDDDPPTIVYISGCTGTVLATRTAGDEDSGSWCGHRND